MTICSTPPEEIPRLLEQLEQGFDVVYGTPEERTAWVSARSRVPNHATGSEYGHWLGTSKNVSAFRVFRTRLRDAFAEYQSPFVSIDVLLTWATTRIGAITVGFRAASLWSFNLHV